MNETEKLKFYNFIITSLNIPSLWDKLLQGKALFSMVTAIFASFIMHFNCMVKLGTINHSYVRAFMEFARHFDYKLETIKEWSTTITMDFQLKNSKRG